MAIDRELILEFFLTVSRIEYALKNAGYFERARHGGAQPDWNRFAREIAPQFEIDAYDELQQACLYYITQPPDEQVVRDGRVVWSAAPPRKDTEFERILFLVKRVRNNLFHGGKSNPQGSEEANRNTLLIQFGLVILNEALRLNPEVRRVCEQAAF